MNQRKWVVSGFLARLCGETNPGSEIRELQDQLEELRAQHRVRRQSQDPAVADDPEQSPSSGTLDSRNGARASLQRAQASSFTVPRASFRVDDGAVRDSATYTGREGTAAPTPGSAPGYSDAGSSVSLPPPTSRTLEHVNLDSDQITRLFRS
jgi:hypothetical protein